MGCRKLGPDHCIHQLNPPPIADLQAARINFTSTYKASILPFSSANLHNFDKKLMEHAIGSFNLNRQKDQSIWLRNSFVRSC